MRRDLYNRGMEITLAVGELNYVMNVEILPPVGTYIYVHKHLTDDGSQATVEVTGHEWRLEESHVEEAPEITVPDLQVKILTKKVDSA